MASLDLKQLRREVEERGLTPCHVFAASLIASLAKAGMLNQAMANYIAKHSAPVIHSYLKAMGLLDEKPDSLEELVERLNTALGIGARLEIRRKGDEILVGLGGESCRYCPKAVGKAEIPGTACPFPRLLEAVARLEGFKVEAEPWNGGYVKREKGLCWIRLRQLG